MYSLWSRIETTTITTYNWLIYLIWDWILFSTRISTCLHIMKVCQRNNYIPLSSHDCARLYSFIVRVLLDAPADSPIDLSLRSDNRTNIYRLRDLLRKPGLILQLRWIDINDANIEKRLTEEEYDSILALDSYLNNLQNKYGPIKYGVVLLMLSLRWILILIIPLYTTKI